MKIFLISFTAFTCVLAAPRAFAIDPLTATELQAVCEDAAQKPDTTEARLCLYYVKGFLDGAVATDGRVAQNVIAVEQEMVGTTHRLEKSMAVQTTAMVMAHTSRARAYSESSPSGVREAAAAMAKARFPFLPLSTKPTSGRWSP